MPLTLAQRNPPLRLETLVSGIKTFAQEDRNTQKAFVEELVALHPLTNVDFGPGHSFRRAQIIGSSDYPDHVDEVIWRKNAHAKLGRANPEGYPVLYLADQKDTALRELRVEDARVVIAEFQIQSGRTVRICPIGEIYRVVRTGRGFLSGDASKGLLEVVNGCSLQEARSLAIADAFLYDALVGHDDHTLSSLVAHAVFTKLPAVTAVAYASRQQLWGLNLAVQTDHFWRDWCLVSVRRARARHLAHGFYRLSDVTNVEGVFTSGRFKWAASADRQEAKLLLEPYVPRDEVKCDTSASD